MKIGEFFVQLGFQADNAKLKDFIHGLGELNLNSIVTAAGLGGVAEAIKQITEAGIGMAKPLNEFQKLFGGNTTYLQQFEKFSQRMGVSAGTATQTLKNFQKVINDFHLGKPDSGFMFGVSLLNKYGAGINSGLNETKESINEKVFKGLQKLPPVLRQQVLELMHINEEMAQAYITDQKTWDLKKKIEVLTEQQRIDLMKYNESLVEFGQDWQMILGRLAVMFEPFLKKVVNFLDAVIKVGGEMQSLKVIVDALGVAMGVIWNLNPIVRFVWFLLLIPKLINDIIDLFKKMGDSIPDFLKNVSVVTGKIGDNPIFKGISNFNNDILNRLDRLLAPMTRADVSPATSNNRSVSQNFTFHVATNDPDGFSRKFQELQKRAVLMADRQNPAFGF